MKREMIVEQGSSTLSAIRFEIPPAPLRVLQKQKRTSPLRRLGSRDPLNLNAFWIPACAGMTVLYLLQQADFEKGSQGDFDKASGTIDIKKRYFQKFLTLFIFILLCHPFPLMAQNDTDSDSASTETTQDQDAREHEAAEMKANELLASSDLPEGTKKVSLTQALQLAQKRNLTLKQMNLEFEKADARLHQARALLLPVAQAEVRYIMADHADEMNMAEGMQGLLDELGQMLSGIPGYTPPADGGAAGSENVVINPRHTVNGSVTVSVPLVNLSNWRNYHLARSGNQLTALSVEEVRQNVLYGTAQAYFMALMSTTLVDLFKEQIVASRAHLRVAEEKFYAGTGLRIDMLRAGIDFEQAEEDLLNARVSLAAACDALGILTGENGMIAPLTVDALVTPDTADATLESKALEHRVDLQLKRKSTIVSDEQVKAAVAALFPSLSLAWQGSYQFTEPSGFGSTDRSRWNLVLALSIPLFNSYTNAKIDESRAVKRQYELEIENLEQSVGQQVRQAKREHETALTNVRGARRRVKLAQESLQLAEAAYAAGAGTSLDVTDARRMYLQAGVNLATTELKTQLTLLALLKSIGEKPANLVK